MSPPQDRSLDHLHPLFRDPLERWLAAARAAGFRVQVYETHRTPTRQAYLYSLGRTRPGHVVTYTLDSSHLYGVAADLMVLDRRGQADWSWGRTSGSTTPYLLAGTAWNCSASSDRTSSLRVSRGRSRTSARRSGRQSTA